MSERGGTYLLTWTTYGTWLPGDERGFVSIRPDDQGKLVINNARGSPYDRDMPEWEQQARSNLIGPEVALTPEAAMIVAKACEEVAHSHGLTLRAGAIMRTHAHIVVASPIHEGMKLMQLFKGVSARRLSQSLPKPASGTWWTRHGSRRLLSNAPSVIGAIDYVHKQRGVLARVVCDEKPPTEVGGSESGALNP